MVAAASAAVLAGTSKLDHLPVALTTGGVCLLIALLGQLPIRLLSPLAAEGAALGFVMGTLVRLGLTVCAMLVIQRVLAADAVGLAMWAVGWYLVLLIVEVTVLIRYLASRDRIITAQGNVGC